MIATWFNPIIKNQTKQFLPVGLIRHWTFHQNKNINIGFKVINDVAPSPLLDPKRVQLYQIVKVDGT
jgi:hypothetical protein